MMGALPQHVLRAHEAKQLAALFSPIGNINLERLERSRGIPDRNRAKAQRAALSILERFSVVESTIGDFVRLGPKEGVPMLLHPAADTGAWLAIKEPPLKIINQPRGECAYVLTAAGEMLLVLDTKVYWHSV